MSANLYIPDSLDRKIIYDSILPQLKGIVEAESNLVANLANISAILKEAFNFFWVGFYITDSENEMVLGPFQGPIACTRINFARGVCGAVATQQKTLIVPNVQEFSDHIACSSDSKSEIVVPLISGGKTKLVLDIDSDKLDDFSVLDQTYIEQIITILKDLHFNE